MMMTLCLVVVFLSEGGFEECKKVFYDKGEE